MAEGAPKWRLWQKTMIWMARNATLQRGMQGNPLSRHLARRFVGGQDSTEAQQSVSELARSGRMSSPYYLGEYVDTRELVDRNVAEIVTALNAFTSTTPPVFFSIDPTQIGYSLSDELGEQNALRIAEVTSRTPALRFLMLDMEDESYVERTIALYHKLRETGVRVAITLQAYLRRTERDYERLATQGATIRLVKGAFLAGKDSAWSNKREIDAAYRRLALLGLSPEMRAAGFYPIFATHDERILEELKPVLRANGWQAHEYEIEMLLGVREQLQLELVEQGYPVRVYVPYGTAWWPYTARRVGENPANARFVLQALWGR